MLGIRFSRRLVPLVTAGCAALVWAAAAIAAAPVNTAVPTITGTPAVGETLTGQDGTWANNPATFEYRW
jgi:hypothetical protein